jgi:SAM-dependent methyltransferase
MTPPDCLELYEDAEFYDTEFSARNVEIPFYRKYAQECGGAVLEVACGTGRITLPIARDGVDVTGLDVSRPMLEQARRKSAAAGLNIEWLEQDCRDIRHPRLFALVFSATNAMQHLLDLESTYAFLQSAKRMLQPDGQLILDVFNPHPAKLARTAETRYIHKTIVSSSGDNIRVDVASHYRSDVQVLHFELFYMGNQQVLRTKRVNMRCFFPEELLALCRFNGLEVIRRFGDYDESAFCNESPKQLLICRKS